MKPITQIKLLLCLAFAAGSLLIWHRGGHTSASAAPAPSSGPTHSGPIAITPDDRFVWVANPDNNSVSVINVQNDANQKVAEIPVGNEPNNLAITPDGQFVYVVNTVSGTVSVINATTRSVVATIQVGTEPYGAALTPNGRKLYVANARSNDVSVIDTAANRVIRTITGIGLEPHDHRR